MLQLQESILSNVTMKLIKLLLFLLFATSAYAENKAEDRLIRFLDNMQTLQANFKQTLVDDQGMELESSSGVVYLKRPNKFRWDYKHPYQQTIVTNGEVLWFYDEDLEQVIIREASSSVEGTPVAAEGSLAPVADTYFSLRIQTDDAGNVTFYYNGVPVGYLPAAIAFASTDLLTPYVGYISRTTTPNTCTVSRITSWQDN